MNSNKNAKSKPITTSVPSFAIRFQAGGEEIEELFPDEEEEKPSEENITPDTSKQESSPMRDYLNKFGKRSSSIDTGINDAPLVPQTTPSDPWRIFSEFKGKLTKTVEEKLSEIKSKNENESSPCKSDKKPNTSKDNSSVSDSEDQSISECSVPKSVGLSSTAEDAEVSSEDENSLVENDKTPTELIKELQMESPKIKKHLLRHRFKPKQGLPFVKDGGISMTTLTKREKLGLNDDDVEDEVESGVEAIEEYHSNQPTAGTEEINTVTMVAPEGYVDMRLQNKVIVVPEPFYRSFKFWIVMSFIILCVILPFAPVYIIGFITGAMSAAIICFIYLVKKNQYEQSFGVNTSNVSILEIPAVKEYQPVTKFEGWLNEYPESYNPYTYHIMKTQSVYVKLEGNIIRISHTRSKVPKRAMWDEPKHNVAFTHHRIYNLKGAQVLLLPRGLTYKRIWSKKYPICVVLNKDNMHLDLPVVKKSKEDGFESETQKNEEQNEDINNQGDNEDFFDVNSGENDSQSSEKKKTEEEINRTSPDYIFDTTGEDDNSFTEDWDTVTFNDPNMGTKFFLFGRTGRDKEDWYRRLVAATHTNINANKNVQETEQPDEVSVSESVDNEEDPKVEKVDEEAEYLRYMARYNQVKHKEQATLVQPNTKSTISFFHKKKEVETDEESDIEIAPNILWFNVLIGRVLFDVFRNNDMIIQLQDRIQRKLSTIKLPYFIEELVVSELSLGNTAPIINRILEPTVDEKGLWVDMDIAYKGVINMALATKLNLIKLKEQAGRVDESASTSPPNAENSRSPMFNSDIDDSAESSSDDESIWVQQMSADSTQDASASKPNAGGKKFLRMVDKIAASKYFQHATEYKYIKRAMEGVSRTELKLKVELRGIDGTLTLNIPTPPSDRIWIGFKGNPKVSLSASPAFGDRSLNFMHVTRWIEKKLNKEFQKFLVLPNMEDFAIPIMNPRLPT